MSKSMFGVLLPGNNTVETKAFPVPAPGYGQVLVQRYIIIGLRLGAVKE